jgi:serine/threonine-protein kinase
MADNDAYADAGDAREANKNSLRGELDQIKIIATGGMSQIFRARQPSLDRFIVVKKLKDELLFNPETVERFRREAKALASVLHQNVAHVYDFVENGRESYILMEYIEGIDLSALVEKVGHLPPRLAGAILLGVARGVSYLHVHNLIHRDIKPSNIRLTTRGEVKLMDFGIVMDIENQGLTRPGMMVGSPSYLSPEQILGDAISPKADIFLLGICFYEMLTGTRPFKDGAGQTVFQRIRESQYVPVREMQSSVPKALEKIVTRCLQKNPDRRFSSVRELIAELERFLGPVVASHTEDVILKFLDEEALLAPTVAYDDLRPRKSGLADFVTVPVAIVALLALLAGTGAGFALGRRHAAFPPTQVTSQATPAPATNSKASYFGRPNSHSRPRK